MFYHNRFYLLEQAKNKTEFSVELSHQGEYAITHLLCIYFWPNTEFVSHWISEVYAALPRVQRLKHNNKLPTTKLIYDKLYGEIEEDFISQFDVYKDVVLGKENELEEPKNLNANKIHDYLDNYFRWLADRLSKEGKVNRIEVENKINELLSKYR